MARSIQDLACEASDVPLNSLTRDGGRRPWQSTPFILALGSNAHELVDLLGGTLPQGARGDDCQALVPLFDSRPVRLPTNRTTRSTTKPPLTPRRTMSRWPGANAAVMAKERRLRFVALAPGGCTAHAAVFDS